MAGCAPLQACLKSRCERIAQARQQFGDRPSDEGFGGFDDNACNDTKAAYDAGRFTISPKLNVDAAIGNRADSIATRSLMK
jgi:hypothetical protein